MLPYRWFVACLVSLTMLAPVAAQQPPELVIGFVGPMDDPDAFGGASAAQMAIDEINASQARGAPRLRLLIQNDKADVRVAEHIARYLVKTDAIAVIGHWTSTASIAAAPIYTEAGMAQLAPISWSSLFSKLPGRNHFQGVGSDDIAMRHTLQYLSTRLSLKKVMVIDDRAVLGVAMADSFEKYARASGIEVLRQSVSTQTSDFNPPLLLARRERPELIVFTGRGGQSAVIARNLKRLDITAKLLLTGPVVSSEFLQKTGHTDEDLYAIVPGLPKENTGKMEAFRKRYVAAFDREPAPFAMFAYDSVYMMAAAIGRAGVPERARIIAALREVSHNGLMQQMAFNQDGTLKNPVFTLYQTEAGRWTMRRLIKAGN
ncbi:branched-chain amino acid ABC transporter substrate-binding protein [Herbaspirillum sp. YR522]|uniref:branched-chain amino acid ABC transporter substrate-binding protein n=1 Tax=Herbaspirillum sp. YR522 TaxID=1144342 RepID=UPI00026F9A2F|nr:branched-chain amino acid ABC transporter substrate-binding protein [Herbaspirillum sp. YR522]EJN00922.1 ABC-type branched-chain amino acid transport system, periplasmic component [Herbaspirillum sp. YR522]